MGGYDGRGLIAIFCNYFLAVYEQSLRNGIITLDSYYCLTAIVTAIGSSLDNYRPISWEFLDMFISWYLVLIELSHKLLSQFYGRIDKKTGLMVQVDLWKDYRGIKEIIITWMD
jgi:hypothetical protein